KGLSGTDVDVYSDFGSDKSHPFYIDKSESLIKVRIELSHDVEALEIPISNPSDIDVVMESFEIRRLP
ncbi:MAG: hypothetical protein IJU95_00410, partial [Treponema sp.]|nr:hypothetical protein [Treponema sp.]